MTVNATVELKFLKRIQMGMFTVRFNLNNKIDDCIHNYMMVYFEVLAKYLPGGLCGYDKEGCPVKYELIGQMDIKGIAYSAKKSDFIKTKMAECEETLDMWNAQSIKVYNALYYFMKQSINNYSRDT